MVLCRLKWFGMASLLGSSVVAWNGLIGVVDASVVAVDGLCFNFKPFFMLGLDGFNNWVPQSKYESKP